MFSSRSIGLTGQFTVDLPSIAANSCTTPNTGVANIEASAPTIARRRRRFLGAGRGGPALGGDDEGESSLSGMAAAGEFTVQYPDTWRELSDTELAGARGATAGLRREDGRAFLIVRPEKAARTDYARFERQLDREFRKRFKDFRKGTARVLEIDGKEAFSYSYIRERRGTVHGVVVVPAGKRSSFTLNTVVQAGANSAARELGRILVSFES